MMSLIRKIGDYLFKDVNIISGFTTLIVSYIIIILTKLVFIGIQENFITTYFEMMVIFFLLTILIWLIRTNLYLKGWSGIIVIIIFGTGILFLSNSYYSDIFYFSFRFGLFIFSLAFIYRYLQN